MESIWVVMNNQTGGRTGGRTSEQKHRENNFKIKLERMRQTQEQLKLGSTTSGKIGGAGCAECSLR